LFPQTPFTENSGGRAGSLLKTQICGAGLPDAVIVWVEGTLGVNGTVVGLVKTGGAVGFISDSETRSKTQPGAFSVMLVEM
jgi:hypothetical protein